MKNIYFLMLAIMLVIFSCKGNNKDQSAKASEAKSFSWKNFSGTSITFSGFEHPVTDGVREILSEFTEETGIQVNINSMAENLYWDRMNVALRSDGNVDVYMVPMDGDSYVQQKSGLNQSLSPFIENPILTAPDYDFNEYPSTVLDLVKYSDGYYAIPVSLETYILMYNKEIVNQYLDGKLPTSMEELIAAANKISKQGTDVSGSVMRGIRSDTLKDTISGLIFNTVGDRGIQNAMDLYFSDPNDFGSVKLDDPDIQKGLLRYAQLMQAGPNNIQSLDWPEAARVFKLGKAAFFIDANLFGPSFEEETSPVAGKVGYAVLPTDNAEGKSYSGFWGWGLGIAKTSKAPEAAWYFIQWMTNKKNDPRIAKFHGSPVRDSSWINPDFLSAHPQEYIQASREQLKSARSAVIKSEKERSFYLMIVDAIQALYAGEPMNEVIQKAKQKAKSL